MRADRGRAALCLALLLALLLSGCRQAPSTQPLQDFALPEPEAVEAAIRGEQVDAGRYEATLYYLTSDGTDFAPEQHAIYPEPDRPLAETVLRELLTSPGGSGQLAVVPSETQLLAVECAGGTVTVQLSVDARGVQTDQELYLMYAAISATLLELEGVRGVNVLIDGQSEAVYRLPVGVFCGTSETLVSALAQLQAESDRFLGGDSTTRGTLARNALLYYPSASSDLVLPEARAIAFSDENYAAALIEAMRDGPQTAGGCLPPFPAGLEVLAATPNTFVSERGERVLDLAFTELLDEYLRSAGITSSQFAAAVTLTMCSFVPELDGVRITIGEELMTETTLAGATISLADGIQTRELYSDSIGSSIRLYFAGREGGLAAVERVVPQASATSPRLMLEQLFFGPVAGETTESALPGGVSALDVLGVSVTDGLARVNLSGNFYRQCQQLSAQQERNAAYAIVNTLCRLDTVNGVHLIIEDSDAELLIDSIYLGSMLMYNPGIVEE